MYRKKKKHEYNCYKSKMYQCLSIMWWLIYNTDLFLLVTILTVIRRTGPNYCAVARIRLIAAHYVPLH